MRLTLSVLAAVCAGAALGQHMSTGVTVADKIDKGKDGIDLSGQDSSKVVGGAQNNLHRSSP